jgi:hypothetical protein
MSDAANQGFVTYARLKARGRAGLTHSLLRRERGADFWHGVEREKRNPAPDPARFEL